MPFTEAEKRHAKKKPCKLVENKCNTSFLFQSYRKLKQLMFPSLNVNFTLRGKFPPYFVNQYFKNDRNQKPSQIISHGC